MATAVLSAPRVLDDLLISSPMPELRRLIVTFDDDEVVITGCVSTYYLKQLAQESLRCAVGHRKLINRVTVTGN